MGGGGKIIKLRREGNENVEEEENKKENREGLMKHCA